MKLPTLLIIDLVFVIAWAFPLVLALLHRARTVPGRLGEIEEVLMGSDGASAEELPQSSPGLHYLRLFHPLDRKTRWTRGELRLLLVQEFYEWHSWGRYLLPLSLICVISAVELKVSRDWVVVKLDSEAAKHAKASAGEPATPSSSPVATAPTGPAAAGTGAGAVVPAVARSQVAGLPWLRLLTRKELEAMPASIVLAMLGAIVWLIYEILSRRYSRDLTPQELSELTLRLIAAVPIGYVCSKLVAGWDEPLAFAASAFPVREVRLLLRQWMLDKAAAVPGSETKPTAHLGQVIDGLGNDTVARLNELNVSTAWDLAYANPVALMARTGYAMRVILTWTDQALLVVYFGSTKPVLGRLAIPCALDLCEFYLNHCHGDASGRLKACAEDPAVKDLAAKLDIPATILPERLRSVYIDPHVQFLSASWYADPADARAQGGAT